MFPPGVLFLTNWQKSSLFSVTASGLLTDDGLLFAERKDEVGSRGRAYIFESMRLVGSGVSDAAWTQDVRFSIIDEIHCPFTDEDELLVRMLVLGMRHLARLNCGFMQFDPFAGGNRAARDVMCRRAATGVAKRHFTQGKCRAM